MEHPLQTKPQRLIILLGVIAASSYAPTGWSAPVDATAVPVPPAKFIGPISAPAAPANSPPSTHLPTVPSAAPPVVAAAAAKKRPTRALISAVSALPWLYVDGFTSLGYSRAAAGTTSSPPMLIQWTLGFTAAYRFAKPWKLGQNFYPLVGFSFDFRNAGQYSEVQSTIGNFRGRRINPISPMIGVASEKGLLLRLDLQFAGSYNLANKTVDGHSVAYDRPFGARIMALQSLEKILSLTHWHAGVLIEALSYRRRTISDVSTRELTSSFSVWQAGLVGAYVF